MKVAANSPRALANFASGSNADLSTRSTLLISRILRCLTSASRCRRASDGSSRPRLASISTPAMSASCAPAQALATMARSSRRRGTKIPGVSMNTSCERPAMAMPRSGMRVVWTLCETMASLVPTSALINVDLPTLGAPINAIKPQRVPASPEGAEEVATLSRARSLVLDLSLRSCAELPEARRAPRFLSAIEPIRLHAGAREHSGRGGLLGGTLRAAQPLGGRELRQFDGHAKLGIVVGAFALDLAISRRGQAARLRPFLQQGLGVAQRAHRSSHALAPQPLDQRGGRRISAIDEHRSDQRLADIGENGAAPASAGIRLGSAEPDCGTEIDHPRHIGAG